MHLDPWDRYRYVQESFRVLRPGGMLYVDNLNLRGDLGWGVFQETARLDSAERPPNVSKPSTEDELLEYLGRAGFSDLRSYPGAHLVAVSGRKSPA